MKSFCSTLLFLFLSSTILATGPIAAPKPVVIVKSDPTPIPILPPITCGLGKVLNPKLPTACINCSTGAIHCTTIDGINTIAIECDPSRWILQSGNCVEFSPVPTCSPGYHLDISKNCVACSVGTYSLGGSTSSKDCISCISTGVATCGPTSPLATSCSNGYVLTNGGCSILVIPIAAAIALTHASAPVTAPVRKPCKPGTVSVENNLSKCVPCAIGVYACSGTSPNNVVVISCQHGYFYSKTLGCKICPDTKGTPQGNTLATCSACRSSAVKCSTGGVGIDYSCQSSFFLKKGICNVCPSGTSTTYDNSDGSCQACPKNTQGTKGCNLNVHPPMITSCTSKYTYSIVGEVGTCTLIKH